MDEFSESILLWPPEKEGFTVVKEEDIQQYMKQLEAYKADAERFRAELKKSSHQRWNGIALGFLLGLGVGLAAFFVWGERTQVIVACERPTTTEGGMNPRRMKPRPEAGDCGLSQTPPILMIGAMENGQTEAVLNREPCTLFGYPERN